MSQSFSDHMSLNCRGLGIGPNGEGYVNPCVSIILPCYNSENHIHEALSSCLAQSYKNLEIIAVDDGSTDSTLECLLSFKSRHPLIRLVVLTHADQCNHGVAASRRLAIEHANGDFISMLDSDDVYEPSKIKSQVNCLLENPSVVLCHTAVRILGDSEYAMEHENHFSSSPLIPYSLDSLPDFLFKLHICNSSVMIRASALRGLHYPASMQNQCEDWLLWVLISRKGKFIQHPCRLTSYRRHSTSLSYQLHGNPLQERFARINFLRLSVVYSFPSCLSLRALMLLIRSLGGLLIYYARFNMYWARRDKNLSIG